MYGSELRTCGLGVVIAVLLGVGIGVGWHYFADGATGRTVTAAAATPLAQQDTPNPQLSCPPGPRERSASDLPRLPALSRPNQPDTTHAAGALRVTHAAHTSRARQVPGSDGPDG